MAIADWFRKEDGSKGASSKKEKMSPEVLFQRVTQTENRRKNAEKAWKEALAYYHGQHWITYSKTYRGFIEYERKSKGSRATVNLFQSYVGALVSMLSRNQPIPSAQPESDSPEAMVRARAADALIRHIWRQRYTKVQARYEETCQWSGLTGTGYIKTYWDGALGTRTEIGPDGVPYKIGEPVCEALSPFSVGFCDVTTFDRSPWFYQRGVFTPEYVYNRFGIDLEPDSWPEDTSNGGVLRFDIDKRGEKPIGIDLVEWWEYPCELYPEGLHYIASKKKMILEEPFPEDSVRPIHQFNLEYSAGSPLGHTPFSDGIAPQQNFNRLISDILDHVTTANNPGLISYKGQLRGPVTNQPGKNTEWEAVPGTPAGQNAPQPFQSQRLEQWVLSVPKMFQDWLEITLGISGISLGQTPFSRISGRASGILLEQTTNRYANTAIRAAEFLSDVGTSLLELWRKHGPIQETVRVLGNDGKESWLSVSRESFGYHNLYLEPSEVLATSKVARIEQYEKWLQYGAIDANRFVQLVSKLGYPLDQLDPNVLDVAVARRDIEFVKVTGQMPAVKPPMNFAIEYEEVAKYMKTAEFGLLDDQFKAAFDQFLDLLHQQIEPPAPPPGAPPNQGPSGGPETPASVPGGGISGPVPSSPGPQNVPPEMAGSMNPPGIDQSEERALGAMT